MEGADVETSFTQGRADAADKSGRVFIDDIQHVAFKFGFQADAKNLDQTRLAVGEQGTRDRTRPLAGIHRHADQGVIGAYFVVTHFANIKAALLRQIGRVDHIYGVGEAAHKAR